MRTLLVLILSTASLLAQVTPLRFAPFMTQTAVECSKGDTTNLWDIFIEGFTSGYDTNYTVSGATTNLTAGVDSSALTTGKPPGVCDTSARAVIASPETYVRARADFASDLTNNTTILLTFCLYVDTGPDTSGEFYEVLSWHHTTTPSSTCGIRLGNTTGQLWLNAQGTEDSTNINIDADKWYTVVVSLDHDAAVDGSSITVYHGGSSVGTDAFQRLTTISFAALFFGIPTGVDAGETGDIWFDLIQIDVTP